MSAAAALACVFAAASACLAAWAATSGQGARFLGSLGRRAGLGLRAALHGRPRPPRSAEAPRRLASLLREGAGKADSARSQARVRTQCLEELPELIDVVCLGMSAGVSFDAALGIYCEKYDTMLAARLADAMRSWSLGLATRSEALHDLASSLAVPAFATFVDSATESLAFGAPLARALAQQSQAVRRQRRADVQERIEKAPVKMLVPTGTLVLPAMLLAVMGPLLASLSDIAG